ncbi:zinc-alpha-2-glycoprotein-like isoform X1 [Pseudorasbora parva]|uniref:zinc-alpha-2-glycoprotein-like isoform X1 n=1 Tax=Pseudorasbora parva TaxID=51549 RepID=UPI00351DEDF2
MIPIDKGIFLWFYLFLCDALQERHFLHYTFTVLTRADTFPEFSAVGVANGRQIKHYSDEERVWVRDGRTVYDWIKTPPDPPDHRDWFTHQLKMLSDCSDSQCSELHVLQRIIGCELEKLPDGSVNLTVFDEYGFDGEDLISFNSDTAQWIDKSPKAKRTKEKWDRQIGRNQDIKYYLNMCVTWISVFHKTEKCSPDVRVSTRNSPDDESKLVLTCLATGFYPRDVQMEIRLSRTKLEDQTSEIRPNDDQTFQMRTSVKIDRNHKGSYDCLVNHSSLRKPVSVEWAKEPRFSSTDEKCLGHGAESHDRLYGLPGAVAAVLALALICWRIYKQVAGRSLRAVAPSHREEPAEVARASISDGQREGCLDVSA